MTHVSDDLFVGDAPTNITPPGGYPLVPKGFGPVGRHVTYDIVPLTAVATNLVSALATAQVGALTISPGVGVTQSTTATGTTIYKFDVPRGVQVLSSNTTDVSALTITAYDAYTQPVTELVTLTPGTAALSKKTYSSVASIALGTTGLIGALSIGTSDVFGLPFILPDINDVVSVKWASVLANDAGTAVKADATSPATTSTGDVRGTYKPSSASNGSRRLTITQYLPDTAAAPGAGRAAVLGVDNV